MAATSDHFDGRRFFNPAGPAIQPFSAVPRMLLERRTKWPNWLDEPPQRAAPLDGHTAVVTFIGHSTFLIQTPRGHIITDPMFGRRAGPWNIGGPRRVRPPGVSFDDLPPIALVLLSHNHYDHCDVATLRRLAARFDPAAVTPLGNERLLRTAGLRRIEALDWWQTSRAAPMPVTLTPAHHFSARGLFDRNRALWGGFVIEAGSRRLYFAGDTAYAPFFADIRRRLGPLDVALLPIGAYEPRWFMRSVHMNPDEAVQAHHDLGAPATIGMHYGTFQLTTEGIDDPVRALEAARRARGVPETRFRTIAHGASVVLD